MNNGMKIHWMGIDHHETSIIDHELSHYHVFFFELHSMEVKNDD